MRGIDTLVMGGGQAGLAMSRCLSDRGIDHLVVERGQIAERWRRERWDSLRLLTPNWMTRLPGFRYAGPDPNGYMRVPELVALLDRYAETSAAPVVTGAAIASLTRSGGGFVATGDGRTWTARQVVIATGHCDTPFVPAFAAQGASRLHQLVPGAYRNPAHLPPGGVLIVGASASGLQLADELVRAGRRVILSAGQHTRVPRLYRGADLFSWLDRLDILRDGVDAVYDVEVSRAQPSFQLVGRPSHETLDLRGLAARGVAVVGRLTGLEGERASFADDLIASTAAADLKLAMLLGRIDRAAPPGTIDAPPFQPHWPAFFDATADTVDLRRAGIASVIWATGFRRRYDWLGVPVTDARGEIVHMGGITPAPGLFVLGLQFLRHRSSSFIDGVGLDAAFLAGQIARNLGHQGAAA
jgi:putative flavoprotein involved in K+ transport